MNHRVGYNTRITLFTNESISRNIYIYIFLQLTEKGQETQESKR